MVFGMLVTGTLLMAVGQFGVEDVVNVVFDLLVGFVFFFESALELGLAHHGLGHLLDLNEHVAVVNRVGVKKNECSFLGEAELLEVTLDVGVEVAPLDINEGVDVQHED